MNQTFGLQLYRSIQQLAEVKSDPTLQSILNTSKPLSNQQVDYLYSISEIKTLFDLNQSFKGNESLIKEYIRTFPFGKISAFQQNNQLDYLLQFIKEYDNSQNLNLEVNNLNLTLENATSQVNQLQNQNLANQAKLQSASKLAAIQGIELLSNQNANSERFDINIKTTSHPEILQDLPEEIIPNTGSQISYDQSVLEESTKQDSSKNSTSSIQRNKQNVANANQQRQNQLVQQNVKIPQNNNLSQPPNSKKSNILGKAALAGAFGATSLFGGTVIFDILL
jgi:hypothetical protein